MKNIKNPSYCQKCGVFGEHHAYMLQEEWRGLCNDCAFREHWKDIGTMCDEFTKKSGKRKMKKDKYKLVGSAGSLEQLLEKTIMYFCGSSIVFREIDGDNWHVYNAKGRILSARVVKKGRRYRLEVL